MHKAVYVVRQQNSITKKDRQKLLGQKGVVIWFTGVSGAGKSTLASELEKKLYEQGYLTYILDGDNMRFGLNKDLGFSPRDRVENIRRISEVARLFVDAGVVTLTSLISPYRADREAARSRFTEREFIEVFVKCSLELCEKRDVKGLYKRARAGEIKEFTGISAPYEEPLCPEILLDTAQESLEESTEKVVSFLIKRGILE